MANSSVFISAMALAQMPSLLPTLRQMEIPADATEALRVFSGDDEAIDRATALAGIPRDYLIRCVDVYIRSVWLFDQSPALRIFGLRNSDDKALMRLHRKLLLERLHPDKAKSDEDAGYARRVLEAWKELTRDDVKVSQSSTESFKGPRMRWIRVPVDKISIFPFQRRRS